MPNGTSEASSGTVSSSTSLVANHLANLVPTFDPAKDDLKAYTQKVQLLLRMWPENKYTELATRLILGCSGSAFDKLQLNSEQITVNDKKSIQKLIELLGGQWGQIPLEKKYEYAERALFKCSQKGDETNDSFLARADVMWQELKNQAMNLEELQAYITLRGSGLSAEDKKRVILDSEASADGKLTIQKVSQAVRMLGAGFFQELTSGKKGPNSRPMGMRSSLLKKRRNNLPFKPRLKRSPRTRLSTPWWKRVTKTHVWSVSLSLPQPTLYRATVNWLVHIQLTLKLAEG